MGLSITVFLTVQLSLSIPLKATFQLCNWARAEWNRRARNPHLQIKTDLMFLMLNITNSKLAELWAASAAASLSIASCRI